VCEKTFNRSHFLKTHLLTHVSTDSHERAEVQGFYEEHPVPLTPSF
jgi:hypothetical protein